MGISAVVGKVCIAILLLGVAVGALTEHCISCVAGLLTTTFDVIFFYEQINLDDDDDDDERNHNQHGKCIEPLKTQRKMQQNV